jgi:hypothetical protein
LRRTSNSRSHLALIAGLFLSLAPIAARADAVGSRLELFGSSKSANYVEVIRPFVDAANGVGKGIIKIASRLESPLSDSRADKLLLLISGSAFPTFVTPGLMTIGGDDRTLEQSATAGGAVGPFQAAPVALNFVEARVADAEMRDIEVMSDKEFAGCAEPWALGLACPAVGPDRGLSDLEVLAMPSEPAFFQGRSHLSDVSSGDVTGAVTEANGLVLRLDGRFDGGDEQQVGVDPDDQVLFFEDRDGRERDVDTATAAGNVNDAALADQFAATDGDDRLGVDLELIEVDRSVESGSSWIRAVRAASIEGPNRLGADVGLVTP